MYIAINPNWLVMIYIFCCSFQFIEMMFVVMVYVVFLLIVMYAIVFFGQLIHRTNGLYYTMLSVFDLLLIYIIVRRIDTMSSLLLNDIWFMFYVILSFDFTHKFVVIFAVIFFNPKPIDNSIYLIIDYTILKLFINSLNRYQ